MKFVLHCERIVMKHANLILFFGDFQLGFIASSTSILLEKRGREAKRKPDENWNGKECEVRLKKLGKHLARGKFKKKSQTAPAKEKERLKVCVRERQ